MFDTISLAALLLSLMVIWCISPWAGILWSKWRRLQQLKKLPYYKDWPIVGDVLHMKRNPEEFYEQIQEICAMNQKVGIGKMVIGWHPLVCLLSADYLEVLLRSNVHIDKSEDYEPLHKWLGLGLLTSTGSKWKSRRRLLTPSFHFNILKDFLIVMNNHAQSLKEKLQKDIADKDTSYDIFPCITLNALDIICDTAMGVNFDALNNEYSEYVRAVYLVKDALAVRQRSPWLWPDIIYDNLPIGRKVNTAIAVMHDFAHEVIEKRREQFSTNEPHTKHKVFIDTLLDCKDENGAFLTDNDIREEVDTFMFEGHDTVSAATAHAIHLIGTYPDVQERCHKELDEIFDKPREITMEDLSKMNYLEWCIKETMRLYPSVPWFGRSLAEDLKLSEYIIPKGTSVIAFATAVHMDPEIYPNPQVFDPLRFSPEQSDGRHPYAYIPFSAGPRNCIGQKFAMMELKVILATILRSFSIVSTQKRNEVKPNPGLILQPARGIWVKLMNR